MARNEKRGITISFNPTNIVAAVIIVAWVAAFFADTYIDSFQRPTSLDPLMLLVGGFFLARDSVLRNTNTPPEQQPMQRAGDGDAAGNTEPR